MQGIITPYPRDATRHTQGIVLTKSQGSVASTFEAMASNDTTPHHVPHHEEICGRGFQYVSISS